jgi:MFS family permease
LTPYIILGSVFLIARGFAFNAPAFSAAVPEIVSNEELPSASTLTGLQLNISAIAGPALGGVLLLFVGANTVFLLNALCFLVVLIATRRGQTAIPKVLGIRRAAISDPEHREFVETVVEAQFSNSRCQFVRREHHNANRSEHKRFLIVDLCRYPCC